ncbi:MAG: DUF4783 domain-containing protein [Bacteroidales bacterium]|nr:DUF4783 domain-containing protein [Bacteroidales bacterium]
MKKLLILVMALVAFSFSGKVPAPQDGGYEVFVPIGKYISQGDTQKLSAWFADNLEITIISSTRTTSKSQAIQILKSFFQSYTPRSFTITHTASNASMKYALGQLNAGGEMFIVTIFVNMRGDKFEIQQLKIERQTTVY